MSDNMAPIGELWAWVREIRDDVRDLKMRVTLLEEGKAGINRRLDRMEADIERIKRRLDLVDAP